LENNLESATSDGSPNKFIAIPKRLVPAYFTVRKEAFYCFIKGNTMGSEFIAIKVILKIGWGELTPFTISR